MNDNDKFSVFLTLSFQSKLDNDWLYLHYSYFILQFKVGKCKINGLHNSHASTVEPPKRERFGTKPSVRGYFALRGYAWYCFLL